MLRGLIIAGVDPGTVIGYALLDLDGNLVKLGSFRNKSNDLLNVLTSYGKVIVIGSDRGRVPYLVKRVSRSLHARVICPDDDIRVSRKIKMIDGFLKLQEGYIKIKNKHEKDALAAALFSYKRVRSLLKKIDDGVKDKVKARKVKEIVLLKNVYISEALKEV